ncbi:alpha/beta hydrolase [Leptolyngbya sp. NIES-2104]|uniref:alpha/beta hydrolase n=1 Tax=Leptolyngbya sp. NIES-2104 TaxID=1552121 RepID=UPI0006ECCBDF|nr:alpha/beta hydrolase [Leptolyngbya sp. NIES-2104]GAP96531.1 esterase/lipase/thioesterase [Leptolyngbya sp. NIES-2104]
MTVLILLFNAVSFFLSLWIVIPAPIFSLLPLSVGAPEISHWLVLTNTIALLFTVFRLKSLPILIGMIFALSLSLIPIAQFPATAQQASSAMKSSLGEQRVLPGFRSAPFVLLDAFRGIPKAEIRQTLNIPVAQSDNVPLTMNVYRPMRSGKNPAIVMIYGGAWRAGNPNSNEEFSRYMAAQGYTVLAIDYRHAPRYQFPTQLEDIRTALEFIQQNADQYEVDVDRMAIMGRSAGGHLAMLTAFATDAFPFRAVVNYYSPVELTEGYNNPPFPDPIDSRDVLRNFLGGTPIERSDLYRQASPHQQVRSNLPPILLIYGGKDHIVESKFGRGLYEKLKQNGNNAVLIEIPWAEHAFDAVFNGVSNQLSLYYTERFLASTLK